jgi:AcrR family transcriptional regulator
MPRASVQDPRERILSVAEKIFAERGFDATGTARIAGAAGVPKGLVFYYFPKKMDILLTLLNERIPEFPLLEPEEVASPGDPAGSLLRIAQRLELGEHDSLVLRIIIHREDSTHRMVRDRVLALREHLVELTESVLDRSISQPLDPRRRRHAAQAFVAVMFGDANARRLDLPAYDLAGAAEVIVAGLLAPHRSRRSRPARRPAREPGRAAGAWSAGRRRASARPGGGSRSGRCRCRPW